MHKFNHFAHKHVRVSAQVYISQLKSKQDKLNLNAKLTTEN